MESSWKPLYRAGAWAAIAVLVLVPFQIAVFILWPLPETVEAWFALFETNTFAALADLDVLMIVDNVLLAVLFLAVCVALRRSHPSWLAIGAMFEGMAIVTYLSSNTALEMLTLSGRYAASSSGEERAILLAAGEAMVATWTGSAFTTAYVLSAVAILILSGVMLRSRVFGRPTAWVGLVFGALSIVPASAGTPGLVFSLLSLIPMWLWLGLLARRLLQLASTKQEAAPFQERPLLRFAREPA